jgi:hypothetical protein
MKLDKRTWVNITSNIKYKQVVTNTKDKWGYIIMTYGDTVIGSIGMNGVKLYEDEHLFSAKGGKLFDERIGNIMLIEKCSFDNEDFYFKIYIREDTYIKFLEAQKPKKDGG